MRRGIRVVLAMRATVAGAVVIVENASGRWRGGIVRALHRGPAVCVAQIVYFTLLQEGVVLILVAVGGGGHSGAAGAEVVFVFEVVGRVRGEGCFALCGEGWVGDGVGEGASAAEVFYVAEGHVGGNGEEDADSC
jgi:hypothetical protein